jgi:hypothetical protein
MDCHLIHILALFSPNQAASVAGHGCKHPSTTLTASADRVVIYMQSFYDILYPYCPTIHALISLETLWRIYLVKPQKLCVSLTAITPKAWVIHDNILLPTVALSTN